MLALNDESAEKISVEKSSIKVPMSQHDDAAGRLSPEEYDRAFTEFYRRSSEDTDVIPWLSRNATELELTPVKHVLSVSGGTGSFDTELLRFLPAVKRYAVFEPNSARVEQFRVHVGFDDRFTFHETLPQACPLNTSFDLALVSHCLYNLNCDLIFRTLMRHARSWLIFHHSELGYHELQDRFGDAVTRSSMYSSKDAERDLSRHGLGYKTYRVDSSVNVANPNADLVNMFLDKRSSPSEQSEVGRYLAARYPDGRMYNPIDVIKVDCKASPQVEVR